MRYFLPYICMLERFGDSSDGEKLSGKKGLDKAPRMPSYTETREALAKLQFERMVEDIDFIESRYTIKIEFATQGFTRDEFYIEKMTPADLTKKALLIQNFRKDLAKLPPVLWEKLQLNKIVFADTLMTERGRVVGSVSEVSKTMYLSENFPFFHEVFHRIDTFMPGQGLVSLQRSVDSFFSGSRAKELYSKVEKSNEDWQNAATVREEVSYEGVDENQANYCARLFNLDNDAFSPAHDPGKIAAMKAILLKWSDGLLNEEFWKDIEAGKITEHYWPDKLRNKK